jgi:hypothetical protein
MTERFCRVCRGWHDLDNDWPSNCAPERNTKRADFATPYVIGDIQDYLSPIDGKPITSRSHRREDLKANDCVPWEPGMGTNKSQQGRTPGLYRNPKFAAKRGLPLSEQGMAKAKELKANGQL